MYIACDMNCNNLGNYFQCVGHENEIKKDKSSFIIDKTYYPKAYCYRTHNSFSFKYSDAINYLLPEDYVKWHKKCFGINKI